MGPFETLAGLMPVLPPESVEGLLATYESMAGGGAQREAAAQLLRTTAGNCPDPARRERLLRAASAIESGVVAELTAEEAAARSACMGSDKDVELPPDLPAAEVEDDDEYDEFSYMDQPPPKLPHLRIADFFPGLRLRVGRDFADHFQRAFCEGDLLEVLTCEPSEEGFLIACLSSNIRLSDPAVIENAENGWLQPLPAISCLQELLQIIEQDLDIAEAEAEDEGDDDQLERIEELRDELGRCAEWLDSTAPREATPKIAGARRLSNVFGPGHRSEAFVTFLLAALPVAMED